MIPATRSVKRPPDAKLLEIGPRGELRHLKRASFARLLYPGDLVIANDAATLPASLHGTHVASGESLELRLAGRKSLDVAAVTEFDAIVFGAGDFRTRTEARPLPPALAAGDELALGPLRARVLRLLDHPRFVTVQFSGTPDEIWAGLARHGKPIQYSHLTTELELWDVWSSNAAQPVAFEPPSAGFLFSWQMLADIRARGARFATLTHAAGISSTGDPELDRRLPLDEPYFIPPRTADHVRLARWNGARVVAIGTTVVRALEHAALRAGADRGGVRPGFGIATQRLGPDSDLALVDAILSGAHEPGTSHYELLRAFTSDAILATATQELETHGYRTHEFGDSVFLAKLERPSRRPTATNRSRTAREFVSD